MRKKRKLILLLAVYSIPILLSAQENVLSLEDCRQMALEHNRAVKMASEHEMALTSLKKAAKTQFFPNLSANGTYLRMNKDISLLGEDVFLPVIPSEAIVNGEFDQSVLVNDPELLAETFVLTDFMGTPVPALDDDGNPVFQNYAYLPKDEASLSMKNLFLLNVGFTQPVYMGGKIREMYKMSQYGEQLFKAKKELSIDEIIIKTDEYYWKVVSLKEKLELTRQYRQMIENLVQDLQNIYDEGIITNNEVLKAKVKMNEVELNYMKTNNGLQLARMALNQTLGLPLDTLLHLKDSVAAPSSVENLGAYKASALSQRPEVAMLEQTINLAESGEKIMRSRYLPNIGLTANYTFINPNPYGGFEEEFGGDWNVGVVMNIPIYHWGDRRHTLEAMRHEKRAAEQKYEEAREQISLEVHQKLFTYHESLKKVELTESSLKQAEENLKITKDNFDEGLAKSTDVLEAQTMWQEAYSDYIDAKTESRIAYSYLLKAGGQLNY